MKMFKLPNLLFFILIFMTVGCLSDGPWEKKEEAYIADYIKTNTDYILQPSGLFYYNVKTGTGQMPVVNDTVYFNYVGRFLNGVAFDSTSTAKTPMQYIIGSGSIVTGVDEGLKYMKPGGKSKLLTPSKLAYGKEGLFTLVPGYSPLLWYIELVIVKPGPGK
jgi:FKBP-type peptidyl-prolyl cis-trans isomerase